MTRILLVFVLALLPTFAQSQTVEIREHGRKVGEVRHSRDGSKSVEYRSGHKVGETFYSKDGQKAVQYQGGRRVRELRAR